MSSQVETSREFDPELNHGVLDSARNDVCEYAL
jgi:hypothetical protein